MELSFLIFVAVTFRTPTNVWKTPSDRLRCEQLLSPVENSSQPGAQPAYVCKCSHQLHVGGGGSQVVQG